MKLYYGQKLTCKNGEEVVVKHVTNNILTVEYKGKLYKRPISIIGEKIFIKDSDKNISKQMDQVKNDERKPNLSSYSSGKTPSDYQPPWSKIPNSWPKRMKGPYGKFSYKNK